MKRASERNPREVTRRKLELETLERREVFAAGGLDPAFAYGFGTTVADNFLVELGDNTHAPAGTVASPRQFPYQVGLC